MDRVAVIVVYRYVVEQPLTDYVLIREVEKVQCVFVDLRHTSE